MKCHLIPFDIVQIQLRPTFIFPQQHNIQRNSGDNRDAITNLISKDPKLVNDKWEHTR